MLSSRERRLTHYQVLGLSPTCEPEIIEAAYQSLISKYSDRDGDAERIRRIEAAYEALADPQRRRTYDAKIGKSAPIAADVTTWTVKPRDGSSKAAPSSPADVTSLEPVATTSATAPPIKARRGGTPRKPLPSHDPPVSGNPRPTSRPAPKHLIIPDPPADQAPASLSELLLPADNSPEEPPRRDFGWSRVGLPLAGVVTVIAAAVSAQYFSNGSSPDTDGVVVQRHGPAADGQQSIMPTAEGTQGADQEVPFEGGSQQLASAQVGRLAEAGADPRQMITAQESSTAAQIDPSSTTGSEGLGAAQSASPAPAMAARGASQAAPPAVAENEQVVPSATDQHSKAEPARWISGGLQDSDNSGGRFEGAVGVRITVRPDGYAGGCRVTQSSGNPALDDLTCQIVQQRLQFKPARNAAGQAIQSEVSTTYTWGRKVRKKRRFPIRL